MGSWSTSGKILGWRSLNQNISLDWLRKIESGLRYVRKAWERTIVRVG